jgi:putative ABC transport system permease protein
MLNDLRYALRFLIRRRAFTTVAVCTVALGVGANTAIFSVADSVLFRPLPYAHADRLFVLEPVKISSGQNYGTMPVEDLEAARATGAFDAVMDMDPVDAIYVREGDRVQSLRVQPVPPEYLATLGVRPIYGREFQESDVGQDAVLLTYRTWAGRYGGNLGLLDSTIPTVDGRSMHVIGVLPPSFRTASATAFFTPPDFLTVKRPVYGPGIRASTPIARLAAGITPGAAQARLSAVHGKTLQPGDLELRLVPLRDLMGRSSGRTLTLLSWAALLVFLVGCANLANLVLARGAERQRELAVRASLGGSQWRIARLLVVENLVVALMGGAVGLGVAYWSYGLLVANLPATMARSVAPAFDTRVLVFAVALTVAAGIASGVLPAWQLARADARAGLQLGRLQARTSRAGRKILLSVEVGLALIAVIAALVLGRSLTDLVTKEMGFDAARLVVGVRPVGPGAGAQGPAARAAQFVQHLDAVRAIPGLKSAAAITSLPASGAMADSSLFPRGQGRGGVWAISAGFFKTMGIPVIEGRELDDRESFDGAPVGVLNQTAARLLFPGGHALGAQVNAPGQPARTVVGVVADWRQSLKDAAAPAMYVPFDRAKFRSAQMIVDTGADTPAARENVRERIARVTPDSLIRIEPISGLLDREAASLRFTLAVIGAFALLTLLLAILGVYGVVAFIAGERLKEYGVRVALGAPGRAIGALVLRQAIAPVAAGLLGGVVAATWVSRLLATQILDVVPATPITFGVALALLLGCGVLAAAIPARRASRVDPMIALRAE